MTHIRTPAPECPVRPPAGPAGSTGLTGEGRWGAEQVCIGRGQGGGSSGQGGGGQYRSAGGGGSRGRQRDRQRGGSAGSAEGTGGHERRVDYSSHQLVSECREAIEHTVPVPLTHTHASTHPACKTQPLTACRCPSPTPMQAPTQHA